VRVVAHNPQRCLFYVTSLVFAVVIALNATVRQTGVRVSVPVGITTQKKSGASPVSVVASVEPVALPPARPLDAVPQTTGALKEETSSSPVLLVTSPVPPSRPRQELAELIQKTSLGSDSKMASSTVSSPLVPSAQMVSVQRALNKLGYGPIKTDGVSGSATRQAIEQFEKDRKIDITGEVGEKTRRLLSAQSGIPIER
jgi:hypothetical protein